MEIKRAGSQPSGKGPADWFTGTVRIDPLFQTPAPGRAVGAAVTFEPGARTAWHTHPLGQTLIVTAGCGRVQRWGGPIEEIRPGDVVWFPAGEKHWHGASPTTAMTHIAIQEQLDGKAVDWMEKVSDEQYESQSSLRTIEEVEPGDRAEKVYRPISSATRKSFMQGTVLYGPRDVRFEDRAKPAIIEPTDAIISLPATSICGSDRQKLAREFGATDIVTERGDEGVERIKHLTNGVGADSVLECVGTQESMMQAIRSSTREGV